MSKRINFILPTYLALFLGVWTGCQAPQPLAGTSAQPWKGQVPLPAAGGFKAYLVHRSEVGVWTVKCLQVLERYGCPEIVALDDLGRCTILTSYSGKWTPWIALQDGLWLGGLALGDVDPRRPGRELYVGGKRGNLYQISPLPQGGFDTKVIAYLPGEEIHTLVVGDVDPARAGNELLLFTHTGGVYQVEPQERPDGSFVCRRLLELPGRVRDAVILQSRAGAPPTVATVSRAGEAALMYFDSGRPRWTTIYRTAMGLGRVAVRATGPGEPLVLYITADDGRVLRLERQAGGSFRSEVIYAGPQGPRGIAAGRFHEDPKKETVAIFGYSRRVQLLSREQDGWHARTIFEDTDKGHWLAAGELDGRNGTHELILSGYAGRVVLLTRPPGYGCGTSDTHQAR